MKRFIGYVTTLAIIVGIIPPLSLDAQTVTDLWQGSVTIAEEDSLTVEQATNRSDCEFKDVYTRKYRQPINSVLEAITGSEYTNEFVGRKCEVENLQGNFTDQSYSRDGRTAYELAPTQTATYWFDPAPSGEVVLIATKRDPFTDLYSLGYESDFLRNSGLHNSSLNVQWRYRGGEIPLVDMNGNKVRFFDHAYSSNGRYLAIRFDRVIGVVDLQTLEMTPVGYSQSFSGQSGLGVSNDGRHVAVNNNGLYVYGAENCTRKYDYSQWNTTQYREDSDQYDGCTKSGDLRQSLMQQLGVSTPPWLKRLYFSPNSAELFVGAGIRQADAPPSAEGPHVFDWTEYSFAADNYVSSAQGYLAMGDSFSSGEGDTEGGIWYEQGTDEQGSIDTFAGRNLCHLSRRSYPYLLANELGYLDGSIPVSSPDSLFHSVACSGAKVHNIIGVVGEKQSGGNANELAITDNQYIFDPSLSLSEWQPGFERQIGYISGRDDIIALRSEFRPEAITLGIGGNDAAFGNFLESCTQPLTCDYAQPDTDESVQLITLMAQNKSRLVNTYRKIKEVAPESRIYVHGYPKFVEGLSGTCGNNVRFDSTERLFIDHAVHYMNEVIEAAAQEAGVFYVDVEDIFSGRTLCGADEQQIVVNGLTAGDDVRPLEGNSWLVGIGITDGACIRACIGSESYHPRPAGHELYESAIINQTNDLTASMPDPISTIVPVPDPFFGVRVTIEVAKLNDISGQPPIELILDEDMIQNIDYFANTIALNLEGFLPGSTVELSVHSDPISLGIYQVDQNGSLLLDANLPTSLGGGYHEIHAVGLDSFGKQVDSYQSVILAESENDFDGDGVLNDNDSCLGITNSNIDEDQDGVDDACDNEVVIEDDPEEDTPHQLFCTKLEDLHLRLKEARPRWLFRHSRRLVKRLLNYYCNDEVLGEQGFERLKGFNY